MPRNAVVSIETQGFRATMLCCLNEANKAIVFVSSGLASCKTPKHLFHWFCWGSTDLLKRIFFLRQYSICQCFQVSSFQVSSSTSPNFQISKFSAPRPSFRVVYAAEKFTHKARPCHGPAHHLLSCCRRGQGQGRGRPLLAAGTPLT